MKIQEFSKNNKNYPDVPKDTIQKWQNIVNILAKIIQIPAAIIMRLETPYIEVLCSSKSNKNPSEVGDRKLLHGLYCEAVIKSKKKLLIPNALKNTDWSQNPNIKLGMISYLGFPILWPNGEVFGTICILDVKENYYCKDYEDLIDQFKGTLELHLDLLYNKFTLEKTITKKEEIEKGLISAERELSSIYEQAPLIIILVDPERRVRKANKLAVDFAGRPEGEMLGLRGGEALRCLHSLDDPEGCGYGPICQTCVVRNVVLDTFESNQSRINVEASLPFIIDGKEQDLFLLVSTVPLEINEETLVLVTINNITERKKAEQKVKESEEKYRALYEEAPNAYFSIGTDKSIKRSNLVAEKLFGYTKEELLKMKILELYADTENGLEKAKAIFQQFLNGEPIMDAELQMKHKNGEIIWISLSVKPVLDEKGNVIESRSMVLDITDRKKVEQELKRIVEDLKRSNEELDHFAYVASHDLQEPLRTITSFTQLLQKRYKDKLDEDANQFIKYIVDGAIRLQNLIKDLLSFSRVGTLGIHFKETDMNIILNNVIDGLSQSIKETNAKITNDPLPVIIADAPQMIQLLQNLISNAIKFHGDVSPRIHISAKAKANEWIFSIKDNGIGIDSIYFEKIFVIFQRLHKVGEYDGTGIGLAACKKIVQRHSGKIWVESAGRNKGSTFIVKLPIKSF